MRLIEFPILKDRARPIIDLYNVPTLIDSGAEGIILNLGERTITSWFHGEYLIDAPLVGITGTGVASVYRLKHFQIGELEFFDIPALSLKTPTRALPSIIIGANANVFGADSHIEIDFEDCWIRASVQERVFHAKKLWTKHNNMWRILDFQDGKWVALNADVG